MKQDIIQPMSVKSIHKIVFELISNKDGNALDAAAGQGYLSKKLRGIPRGSFRYKYIPIPKFAARLVSLRSLWRRSCHPADSRPAVLCSRENMPLSS